MRLKKASVIILALLLLLMAAACGQQDGKADYSSVRLKGMKIVIDPGHGDTDVGTIGVSTGRYEKEVNLEIGMKLKNALEQEGVAVVMTRESDEPIAAANETDIAKRKEADMQTRERIITNTQADMYIGVHQNSFENEDASGPQIFYHTDSNTGEKLARCIQQAMNDGLEVREPRKVNSGRYRLLKPGSQPSVTVECGFFTNPDEEKKLQESGYQDQIVASVIDGIKFFEWEQRNAE